MNHRAPFRALALAALLSTATVPLLAQDRSASGHLLNWTNPISVESDSLDHGSRTLPAHSFMVHEADPGTAMSTLRSVFSDQGAKFSGSDPVRATVMVPEIPGVPVLLIATAEKDRAAGGTRMRVTYAANDSTAMEDVRHAAHAMAIQLNRAIVQQQIDAQQKIVDKAGSKLESAQSDQAKAQKKASSAASDLEKAKKEKSKLADKQARLQKEQQRAQERYNTSQAPKDLEKLTKVQGQLVKVQQDLSKQLKKEADAQKAANKRQDEIPDAQKEQQEHQVSKEQAVSELEALKRKLEAIR
ncbi:MAG TPA: hypothetical protein PKE21_14430 [Flavobacteriales bacterium]|nr:hypothetical protein [Flavobacteriales bacterium]HMR28676.1 hypothetical protein [Flavobacteriales bacterium]